MAMKTKKERFHVGALNQDLEGEMSKRGEQEGCGLQNALLNFTSHRVGGKMHREREREGRGGRGRNRLHTPRVRKVAQVVPSTSKV